MNNTQNMKLSFDNGLEVCVDRKLESKKHLKILKEEDNLYRQFTKISCEVDGFSNFQFKKVC